MINLTKTIVLVGILCVSPLATSERLSEREINRMFNRQLELCRYDVGLAINVGKDIDDTDWGMFCAQLVTKKIDITVNQPYKPETNIIINNTVNTDVGIRQHYKIERKGNKFTHKRID